MCGVCKPTQQRGWQTRRALPPYTVNIWFIRNRDTFHRRGSCWRCRPSYQLHSLNLQTKNDFWEAPSVVAFQWLSALLTASLECSALDSTTYSQIEVLDPVEVARLLWQDGWSTDNQLDNGVEAFPSTSSRLVSRGLTTFAVREI